VVGLFLTWACVLWFLLSNRNVNWTTGGAKGNSKQSGGNNIVLIKFVLSMLVLLEVTLSYKLRLEPIRFRPGFLFDLVLHDWYTCRDTEFR
jgi:hypothetical protein